MIRRNGRTPGGDEVGSACVRLLGRVRELTESAGVCLDGGNMEAAFAAIDEGGALLEEGREAIEAFVASRSEPPGPPAGAATGLAEEMYRALSELQEQRFRLITRLLEAASGVNDEIARLETTRRTMRAYGRPDAPPTVSVRG